jgi:hypothetical protein
MSCPRTLQLTSSHPLSVTFILVFLTHLILRRSFICGSLAPKYEHEEHCLLDRDNLKHRRSRGTCCLDLQGRKVSETSSGRSAVRVLLACVLGLPSYSEDRGSTFHRNSGKLLSDYVTSDPRKLFAVTALSALNFTTNMLFPP